MLVGMITFAIGFVFVTTLPSTPAPSEISRGGDIFTTVAWR
jgi:hypothetical protein